MINCEMNAHESCKQPAFSGRNGLVHIPRCDEPSLQSTHQNIHVAVVYKVLKTPS